MKNFIDFLFFIFRFRNNLSDFNLLLASRIVGGLGCGIIFILSPAFLKEILGVQDSGNDHVVEILITQFGLGICLQYFLGEFHKSSHKNSIQMYVGLYCLFTYMFTQKCKHFTAAMNQFKFEISLLMLDLIFFFYFSLCERKYAWICSYTLKTRLNLSHKLSIHFEALYTRVFTYCTSLDDTLKIL